MDLGFFRSREKLLGRAAARLEYEVLVATLEALQSASAAARAEVAANGCKASNGAGQEPLVDLVLGAAGWRDAISAQGGCFNASHARTRGNRA